MAESLMWKDLKKVSDADMTRHEDKLNLGIPDVSYGLDGVNGWIELKQYDRWPSDPQEPLPFRNLKPLQRRFLRKRGRAGGHCFILLRVGNKRKDYEFYLISWKHVTLLGELTREEIGEKCVHAWKEWMEPNIDHYLCKNMHE